MKIINNYLLLRNIKEFDQKTVNYFFNRIRLFLYTDSVIPRIKVILTKNKSRISKYFGGAAGATSLAFYADQENVIVLNAELLSIKSKKFIYDNISSTIDSNILSEFKYCIHLPLLYHELVHHFQYNLGSYKYSSLLEGTADIFSYILTGEDCIDYELETTTVWYIGRKILKYSLTNFYNFIISIINNDDQNLQQRFSNNKSIIKILVNKYNSDWAQLFKNLHKEYGNLDNLVLMKQELNELHNLIFYKY